MNGMEFVLALVVAWACGSCAGLFISSVGACAADGLDAMRRIVRRTGKNPSRVVTVVITSSALISIVVGLVVSIVTTPLIVVVHRLALDRYRHELYLVHVVGPAVRKSLRERYGSATAAD